MPSLFFMSNGRTTDRTLLFASQNETQDKITSTEAGDRTAGDRTAEEWYA